LVAGEALCPTCRRPITADDRERFSDIWHAEGTTLGDTYRANRETLKELDQRLSQLDEDVQRLAADDLELAGLRGQFAQLANSLTERERHELAAAESAAELSRVDGVLVAGDFAHEARARLAAAEFAIAQLDYDSAAHEHAEQQERVWQPFVDRRRDLELARSQHTSVEATLATLHEQHAELSLSIASTSALVAELAVKLADVGDLRERRESAHETCDALDIERGELRRELGRLEGAIAVLTEVEQQRDELSQRTAALALDIGALSELVRAFGKDGIQAMIVENILPELQDEANEILRRMSTSQLQVTFRSQREALSSDKSIETLDIIIRDEYGERPYALYSGGEAFRVNFAVRVALSKLLARRAGARIDVLVVDEGFGTQDSRGRDGLIEALRSIEDDFATILVITHIGEIRDLFPTRIDIVKSDRGSLISVN
jgi:exonuclease SbcC